MSVSNRYVLDTNVFVEARRRYYAFDICPGFWAALERQFKFGVVCSVDRVRDEIVGEGDELAAWAKSAPVGFFKATKDVEVIETFRELMAWVHAEPQFLPAARAKFASAADGWLVAFAKVNHQTLVTHESLNPDIRKEVKIPNVCEHFKVDYCDTFEVLRAVKEQFVLRTKRRVRR